MVALLGSTGMGAAQEGGAPLRPTLNTYGLPGLIDMPTADVMPDADLAFSISRSGVGTRGTLAFQVLPSLTATFRYIGVPGFLPGSSTPDPGFVYYDRSFDLHWQVLAEQDWRPAFAVGIRDLIGTGVYGSEYVVATRHFGAEDRLSVSLGLGWGRLGERGGFTNPLGLLDDRFETRPARDAGLGGTLSGNQYFRGDAALFGGIEWQATDRLRVQLEYSSDTYMQERADGLLSEGSPITLGASYSFDGGATIQGYFLNGDILGASLSFALNPYRPSVPGTLDEAPLPVVVRPPQEGAADITWVSAPQAPALLRDGFGQALAAQGFALDRLTLDGTRATLRLRNLRYAHEAQSLGRALRTMAALLPASVEIFEVIFVTAGMDTSRIRVARSDVEALEHDPGGAELVLALAEIEDARRTSDPLALDIDARAPRFTWGIRPYVETALFDPDDPFRIDFGLAATARLTFGRGFVAAGEIRAPIIGNLDEARLVDPLPANAPPVVRSDAALYLQESDTRLDTLTLSHYGRPAENLYSRVTLGYLERMYAGISAELLWQPADGRLALGAELNQVWQRDHDGGFGLRDYDVLTGHVSAYYRLSDEFRLQVDAGRYLAGDWGTTFRVSREFAGGWRIGAFATFTDVSFEEFGEGSFDKGIEIEMPLTWLLGTPTRQTAGTTLRPVLRDGGARLSVDGRLSEIIGDYTRPNLEETEAMVWR